MGLQLSPLVKSASPADATDLKDTIIAVDANNLMYAPYTAQLANVVTITPEIRQSALAFATRTFLNRILELGADYRARSLIVFDGAPHALKQRVLEEREATRKAPRIEAKDFEPLIEILLALGVPILRADHDADRLCAQLARANMVHIVASTDWDVLAMGAPTILRGLSQRSDGARGWSIIRAHHALGELGLTDWQELGLASVLMGCDYAPGRAGIGPKKACQHARSAAGTPSRLPPDLQLTHEELQALAFITGDAATTPVFTWARADLTRLSDALERARITPNDEMRSRLARLDLLHAPPTARVDDAARESPRERRAREEKRATAVATAMDKGQSSLGAWLS